MHSSAMPRQCEATLCNATPGDGTAWQCEAMHREGRANQRMAKQGDGAA